MAERKTITQEYLKSILDYDPETGVFTWRWRDGLPNVCNYRDAGKEAGTLRPTGYRYISIDHRHWAAHRLAYIIMTGEQPVGDVDHINLNKSDNRWRNLRLATRSQNQSNVPCHKRNKSGIKGVHLQKDCGRWVAYITVNRKRLHLGMFATKEEAAKAREDASARIYGEFSRLY
ncbi:HNH endonuclease [Methylocystis sp. WRRC1]|uniref:HNH endonuclease n=1 Tax=Methylocystis sp. WRRC1 TaxID=1732014 RepID=UPI001D142990|nr:HNH endonuclease [Methylocystis sp. WRRC1]MCC3246677.1 HNH endonuclease [Methylocystis sp. WRRC1]